MTEFEDNIINEENGTENDTSDIPFIIPKREVAGWNKRDTVFAAATALLSVLFVDFSLFGLFNAGFTVSYIIFCLLTVLYLKGSGVKLSLFPMFCGLASICGSFIFSLYNDPLTNTVGFALIAVLYGTALSYAAGAADNNGQNAVLYALKSIIYIPFKFLAEPFYSYGGYFRGLNKKSPKQVFLGLALALPVLFAAAPLLISSDAAFESVVTSLFSSLGMSVLELIMGIMLAVFLFSMFFAHRKKLFKDPIQMIPANNGRGLEPAAAVTMLTVICVFYAFYLLSQLTYFFSAFSGIFPKGYTFTAAGYARRGFFELCAVAAINLLVVFLIVKFTKYGENKQLPLAVKLLSVSLCVFSVVFTATALSKMILYIDLYAFTRLRLLTSAFMVGMTLVFAMVIIYIFKNKFSVVKAVVVLLSVLFIAVGLTDIDKTVARYNVSAYQKGKISELDVKHLGSLSDSAVPYVIELLDCKDEEMRTEAAKVLYRRALTMFKIRNGVITEETSDKLTEYNYSRKKAKAVIKKNFEKIENYCPPGEDIYASIDYFDWDE